MAISNKIRDLLSPLVVDSKALNFISIELRGEITGKFFNQPLIQWP